MPAARAADAAARVFSTLKRDSPASVIGTSTSSTSGSASAPALRMETQPSMTVVARPPASRTSRIAGEDGSRENTHGWATIVGRIARTRGSSPFRTAQPPLRVILGTTPLTSASWSSVSMPCSPRWSAVTLVTTETSLRVRPMPLSRIPPRAVSVTANSTFLWARTRPAPLGPGVVARLDQLAVDVDAVGVRPADEPAVGPRDVGDHPRGRGLAVGAGDRDDRDLRGDRVRPLARLRRPDGLGHAARPSPRRRRAPRRPAPRPRPGPSPGPADGSATGRRPRSGAGRWSAGPGHRAAPCPPRWRWRGPAVRPHAARSAAGTPSPVHRGGRS